MQSPTASNPEFNNPVLGRFFLTPEEKANKERGKAILKAIYATQTSNDASLNYFKARNARWIMLLLWAKGTQPINEFLDYMSISDANKAWVNIDPTPTRIAAQFVGTLVESMSKTKTYPSVNAVDDGSMSQKEDRLLEALHRMHEVATIQDVQNQAGIQLEPAGAYVPDDEMSARVYFEIEDKLPKEIRFEKLLASTQNSIQFESVLNRKTLYDLTVLNCGATKIERVSAGVYTVRKCVPTNMVYNFFINDTGKNELSQIGEFYGLKVKDFRCKFGKSEERPDGLSEKEIFELAKISTNKNIGVFNYMWNDTWALTTYNQSRPYDDNQILIFDCDVNFEEDEYYVSKKDAYGKENITLKKNVPYQVKKKDGTIIEQPKPDDVEIIKKKKNTWMRGVYCPYSDTMLYWGKTDLIITPYTDVACPLSAYTINIPNNDGEYVPSLFERTIEPLREYQVTKLKRKQLIAQIRPSGIRIDVESARNIDLGNGDTIAWEEVLRIFNQTGTEVWSSKGVDPLQKEAPAITNTAADDSIRKVMELTNVLSGIIVEIRQLIGVPQYRDGSDVGDRTSGVLQEQQMTASYNVSDFVLNGNNQLWEETFYKLCLLHWNDIVKKEPESKDDMLNTRFEVSVKMKSTDYQKQLLEQDIQRYSQMPDAQGNPSITPKDAMFLREIDNDKLARWYMVSMFNENRRNAIAESERLQSQNASVQQQSAQQAAEQQAQMQADELQHKKELMEFESLQKIKEQIVIGSFQIAAKGEGAKMPEWLIPIVNQLVPNLAIPIAQENKQMQDALAGQEQQEQMAAQQQAQGEQGLPPEEMPEQEEEQQEEQQPVMQ